MADYLAANPPYEFYHHKINRLPPLILDCRVERSRYRGEIFLQRLIRQDNSSSPRKGFFILYHEDEADDDTN
ncbi:MAG: hypothetical protein PHI11_15195, partial [Gallionella sp.]|nr:hypothetical protein [Gallionella sp.]